MATIFEALDGVLSESGFSAQLTVQVEGLDRLVALARGLIEDPPDSVGDLARLLEELPLPELLPASLGTTLEGVGGALPGDLGSLDGDATATLGQVTGAVETASELATRALAALAAIGRLAEIDLVCESEAGGEGDGAGDGDGGDGDGDGGEPPADGDGDGDTPATTTVARADAALDRLPSPLTVEALLELLVTSTDGLRPPIFPATIPVADDLRDLIETALAWRAASPAELEALLGAGFDAAASFLAARLDAAFAPLAGVAGELTAALPAADLGRVAGELGTRLESLRQLAAGGSFAGSAGLAAEAEALVAELPALAATFDAQVAPRLAELGSAVDDLPAALEDALDQIVTTLTPNGPLAGLPGLGGAIDVGAFATALAELESRLDAVLLRIEDLARAVDLPELRDAVDGLVGTANEAADGLDGVLVTIRLRLDELFGEVGELLGGLDAAGLEGEIEATATAFRGELVGALEGAFAEAREALEGLLAEVSTAVAGFSPADLVDGLRDLVSSLAGPLSDPRIGEVRAALEAAADQIESLSFAPLTDEVIAAIGEIESLLAEISAEDLPPPVQTALQGALAVLPASITPLTEPLVVELDGLVASGPVEIATTVRAQPERLLERVRALEPATLVGETLSRPFDEILEALESFRPSRLLEPADAALEELRDRVLERLDPAAAVAPLAAAYRELEERLAALDPERLVEPLREALAAAEEAIRRALPGPDLLGGVTGFLDPLRQAVDFGRAVAALVERVSGVLSGLDGAPAQLATWRDATLARLDAVDAGVLAPVAGAVRDAAAALRAAPLAARVDGELAALSAALAAVDAEARLSAMVRAHRGLATALAGVPASPARTRVESLVASVDPLAGAATAPYRRLADLETRLAAARAALASGFAGWDERYHAPGGALAEAAALDPAGAELRATVEELLDQQLVAPLTALLSIVEPLAALVTSLSARVGRLVAAVEGTVSLLTLAPDTLAEVVAPFERVADRLENFDLGILTGPLTELFEGLRGQLAVLDPARLAARAGEIVEAALATVSLGAVLPAAEIEALDDEYERIVGELAVLDPERLVTEVLQPEFEAAVLPLLEAIDLTVVIDVVIERLEGLAEELRSELGRVDTAYGALKSSASSQLGGSVSAGISL